MFVLYMSGGTVPLFQGHGTSACLSPLLPSSFKLFRRTAKVWTNFQLIYDLVGHTQPVWAVVAITGDEYLTGALPFTIAHELSA
jgi:phospholipase A-2-activating protein